MRKGLYLVAEGQDCNGKGAFIDGIAETLYFNQGRNILDLRECWRIKSRDKIESNLLVQIYGKEIVKEISVDDNVELYADVIPSFEDLQKHFGLEVPFEAILVCEPTWASTGLWIRKKGVNIDIGKQYSGKDNGQHYAEDRLELLSKLIIPARKMGIDVYSERDRTTSYIFQLLQDDSVKGGVEELRQLEGNKLADENRPDITAILELSPETSAKRMKDRCTQEGGKDDKCKFENIPFQTKVREAYLNPKFKEFLEKIGTKVVYVTTDEPRSPKDTRWAGAEVIEDFVKGTLKDKYLYENWPSKN
ncbi:MAG: hypothetical protein U9R08_02595 [Nanoarchaeota archaeon]|nr:hypothetical protein [Nanoarchaeota archaeon]